MSDTATVETLVAEVRTLMVGSRQVTLSVAKQLDIVDLADLTVFGRVKLRQGEHHVIGAADDGSLAIANFRPHPWKFRCDIDLTDLGGVKVPACDYDIRIQSHNYIDRGLSAYKLGGLEFRLFDNCLAGCGIREHRFNEPDSCVVWGDDIKALIVAAYREQWDAYAADRNINGAAASAPLIVLAGLK